MHTQDIQAEQLGVSSSSRFIPLILAAMLGLGLVYASGFLGVEVLHNAAHDTRHAAAFPCH